MTDNAAPAPSGAQYPITFADQEATVVEVGGGLRTYTKAGRAVLEPYDVGAICDGAHGALLIPWPNRLEDGAYAFGGQRFQLPIDEIGAMNAIHGLVRFAAFAPRRRTTSSIVIGHTLRPTPGYPFTLDIEATYTLGPGGLSVAVRAENLSGAPCPYAFGQHPYLAPHAGSIDGAILKLPATTVIDADARHLPAGTSPVAASQIDFREGRPIEGLVLDHAFTDLVRQPDGKAHVTLTWADGHRTTLWAGPRIAVIQVFTGDTLDPERRRRAIAIEPMTAPANAFRTGDRLIILDPGEAVTVTWGVVVDQPSGMP